MNARGTLRIAVRNLPPVVQYWIGAALRSGRYRIGYLRYETDLTVCPVVAGAKMAGIWNAGGVLPGNEEWGTSEGPAKRVWEFVVAFDACADKHGTGEAVEVIIDAIGEQQSLAA
jgi:hypothetical protein